MDQKGKACLILIFSTDTNCENMAIDPLGLKHVQLEVSEKLPQGKLACGSKAFIATLLFDPSMSALPIIAKQNSPSVGLFTH